MDPVPSTSEVPAVVAKPPKPPRGPRASTSSKNRTERSPSPYRSRSGQSTSELYVPLHSSIVCAREGGARSEIPDSDSSGMRLYFGRDRAERDGGSHADSRTISLLHTLERGQLRLSRIPTNSNSFLSVNEFWQHTINIAETVEDDFKHQALPLARIKKVMRSDPEVKMISHEVTIVLEKACQIFIQELTARAHLVSFASGRRTLSRPDVAQAISNSDVYDFLIDIISQPEAVDPEKKDSGGGRKRKSSNKPAKEKGGKRGRGRPKKNAEVVSDEPWTEEEDVGEGEEGAPRRKRFKRLRTRTSMLDRDYSEVLEEEEEDDVEAEDAGAVEEVAEAGPAAPIPFVNSNNAE